MVSFRLANYLAGLAYDDTDFDPEVKFACKSKQLTCICLQCAAFSRRYLHGLANPFVHPLKVRTQILVFRNLPRLASPFGQGLKANVSFLLRERAACKAEGAPFFHFPCFTFLTLNFSFRFVFYVQIRPVSQSCAVAKSDHSGRPLDSQTCYTNFWPQQKLPKFGFRTRTTALWPVEQSSILSAKFDCLVPQKFSLLATAHDCETGLFTLLHSGFVVRTFEILHPGPRGFLSAREERERSGERKPLVAGDANLTIMQQST